MTGCGAATGSDSTSASSQQPSEIATEQTSSTESIIEMAGEMIGAISGIKYKDCNVEIYEYDTSSEKYKELVANGKILMEGFNVEIIPSVIHNQFVMICDDAPNKDELISAFDSLN